MPGVERMAMMVLCIAIGLFCGITGAIAGMTLSNSRFAFWAGGTACAFGIGTPAFFILLVGRDLMPVGYLCLACPLLPGCLAIALSSRTSRGPGEKTERAEDFERCTSCEHKIYHQKVWIIPLIIACVAILFWACYWSWDRPRQTFTHLMAGDKTVEVTALVIKGKGKEVVVDDSLSTSYLGEAFRHSEREGYSSTHLGTSYRANIVFHSGGTLTVSIMLPAHANGLTICFFEDEFADPIHYWIALPRPMPGPISAALRTLRS
jgi:hypothetical protein